MSKRTCIRCGKTFTATGAKRRNTALYCSNECRQNRVTKTCVNCGREFIVKMSHGDATCCSSKCRNANLRRRRQEQIEQEFGKPIFALLYDMYCIQGMGIKQIAKEIGVSDHKLWDWFVELGIARRNRSDAVALQWADNNERRRRQSEYIKQGIASGKYDRWRIVRFAQTESARKHNSESKLGAKNWMFGRGGPLNPHWSGGRLYYYGPSWYRRRNEARARDNYQCQHCGITEAELGKQLDVHHVRKFRLFGVKNHDEANQLSNLISLCPRCHVIAETQSDRPQD